MWIYFILVITFVCEGYCTRLLEDEINENSVIAASELSHAKNDGLKIESIEYKYHSPVAENSIEDDLMASASIPAVSAATHKPSEPFDGIDLMLRSKRQTEFPSFDDIYKFIKKPTTASSRRKDVVSNELLDVLTAKATSNDVEDGDGDSTSRSMRGIMGELKASKHHKLTRNDIRQLAKKAVILATLKKLKEKSTSAAPIPKSTSKSAVSAKSTISKPSKSYKKHKKGKKSKKSHHAEKHVEKSVVHQTNSAAESSTPAVVAPQTKDSEMSEDLSHMAKKSSDPLTDDDPSLKSIDDGDLMPNSNELSKKSSISKIDDSVANMFDDGETSTTKPTEKAVLQSGSQLANKVKSLQSFLAKADNSVIPVKFLPDLPSGLRMIGWKEMIEKKKKQLNELEATVGTVEDATETKPATLNIDVEDAMTSKKTAADVGDLTDLTGDKKSDDPISLQHIGYLQRHIKGARSLRKLIAKTLVGHCKSTGKRIFDAFVAMDKALARAQTIATVIGKKFNIDMDRIDALVGDKEDQVIETFLKDIFVKI